MAHEFPPRRPGKFYLTEGGIETEVMYKHGFELPHFAMFPLLDNPEALAAMKGIWQRALRAAADNGFDAIINGLDYRASPDWGALLGYSPQGLADMQLRAIDFLRDVARDFEQDIDTIVISGTIGPRGDAYSKNETITAEIAEEYHAVQMATLKEAEVDMAWAMTFNNIPEAVGTIRAAQSIGLPIAMGLSLDSSSKLNTGPTMGEAVTEIDAQTDGAASFFGLNCSHPLEFEPALDGGDWMKRLRVIRPNACAMDKMALCKLGHLEDGDPDELAQQMRHVSERMPHMDIFGGCCGTDERHLSKIAQAVRHAIPA